MKLSELKANLKALNKAELIEEIVNIYKKSEFAKDYFSTRFGQNSDAAILKKYKAIIEHEFFPASGFGKTRLSVAKKAISEFKKINDNPELLAELMLFYVENGVKFTVSYGDIYEQFYISMEGVYERVLKLITENRLKEKFAERCHKVVTDTTGIGWGFHDQLSDLYSTYFDDS